MIAQFIGLYPTSIDLNVTADLSLRKLFCDFLCGSLLIVLARREETVEHQVIRPEPLYFSKFTIVSSNTIPTCVRWSMTFELT